MIYLYYALWNNGVVRVGYTSDPKTRAALFSKRPTPLVQGATLLRFEFLGATRLDTYAQDIMHVFAQHLWRKHSEAHLAGQWFKSLALDTVREELSLCQQSATSYAADVPVYANKLEFTLDEFGRQSFDDSRFIL